MFAIKDWGPVDFSVQGIMEAASAKAGLTDFGDLGFIPALEVLVKSFKEEGFAKMSPEKVSYMGASLAALLVSRLQVIADRKKYPEIAKEKIVQPIFFIGMARTGSTLIQSLFSEDPANISPEFWEMMAPSPPPKFGMGDARLERVRQLMTWHLQAAPGFETQHPYFIEDGFRALAECGSICEMGFMSYQFFAFYPVGSYEKWFARADATECAKFHHMYLQHLQWGRSGRHWVSKAVEHGVYIDALIKEYPDAHFVWTHRDPIKQLGSLCSNIMTVRQYSGRQVPPEEVKPLSQEVFESVHDIYDRAMRARDKIPAHQFHDVAYQDQLNDPIGVVRGLYEKMGRNLTAEAELRMQGWLRRNEHEKHGSHQYNPADYGVEPEKIKKMFAEYYSRYSNYFGSSKK